MLLALKFHWSPEEIMRLPVHEFAWYRDEVIRLAKGQDDD